MQIIDFTAAHVEQAAQIAKQNYEEERGFVPALPPIDTVPDLTPYAVNNLGVAAFESDTSRYWNRSIYGRSSKIKLRKP